MVMKGKKFNFTNNSTGYGKSKHHTHSSRGQSTGVQKETKPKEQVKIADHNKPDDDKDLNSGFGEYLRSPDAVEMMKLFVFANSIMLILTMAWPNLKDQYYMLMHWLNSFQEAY